MATEGVNVNRNVMSPDRAFGCFCFEASFPALAPRSLTQKEWKNEKGLVDFG
jgi:hypothetical protein